MTGISQSQRAQLLGYCIKYKCRQCTIISYRVRDKRWIFVQVIGEAAGPNGHQHSQFVNQRYTPRKNIQSLKRQPALSFRSEISVLLAVKFALLFTELIFITLKTKITLKVRQWLKVNNLFSVFTSQHRIVCNKCFLFTFFKGRRPFPTRRIVFLVTDGHSNVDTHLTVPKAEALKIRGVEIYVVAVGTSISGIHEMVKVASNPPDKYLFRVDNLQGFWEVIKLIVKEVSPGKYSIVNYYPPCY